MLKTLCKFPSDGVSMGLDMLYKLFTMELLYSGPLDQGHLYLYEVPNTLFFTPKMWRPL